MTALRLPSARPELLLDQRARRVGDESPATVGIPGPFGRERVLPVLPLKDGPVRLEPPMVVHAADASYLADPGGQLIGQDGVWVQRLLPATTTWDTRRL